MDLTRFFFLSFSWLNEKNCKSRNSSLQKKVYSAKETSNQVPLSRTPSAAQSRVSIPEDRAVGPLESNPIPEKRGSILKEKRVPKVRGHSKKISFQFYQRLLATSEIADVLGVRSFIDLCFVSLFAEY